MCPVEQADQQGVDQVILSDNHLAHFAAQRIDEDAFAFDPFVEFLDVDDFTHFSVCIFDFSLFSVFMQRIPYKIIAKYVFFRKSKIPTALFALMRGGAQLKNRTGRRFGAKIGRRGPRFAFGCGAPSYYSAADAPSLPGNRYICTLWNLKY